VPAAPEPAPAPPRTLGPTAFGAVRFSVPEGAEGQLTLQILSRQSSTPGNVDPGSGPVLACMITSPWDGIQNGRYDQAPSYDCSSAASGQVSGDQLVLDLPSGMISVSGTYDLAIVPTAQSGQASPTPFTMSISAPSDASMIITNADELITSSEEPLPEDFESFDPSADFATTEDFATFDETSAGDFSTEFTADETFSPLAGSTSRPRGVRPQIAVPAGSIVANPFSRDASRGQRIMAVGLLLALAAALFWVSGLTPRAPRLLGSMGGGHVNAATAPRISGIGRFARPRGNARPNRLF
jgi:hypothetical protein